MLVILILRQAHNQEVEQLHACTTYDSSSEYVKQTLLERFDSEQTKQPRQVSNESWPFSVSASLCHLLWCFGYIRDEHKSLLLFEIPNWTSHKSRVHRLCARKVLQYFRLVSLRLFRSP